jgi:hypothetical protein
MAARVSEEENREEPKNDTSANDHRISKRFIARFMQRFAPCPLCMSG